MCSTVGPIYGLQRALSVAGAIPVVGVIPTVVKVMLSVAQTIAGLALLMLGIPFAFWEHDLGYWALKEGGNHIEVGLKALFYAGANVVTLGFAGLAVETLCLGCSKC
jgi:hypothetical protein